jgi:hypothetical protein
MRLDEMPQCNNGDTPAWCEYGNAASERDSGGGWREKRLGSWSFEELAHAPKFLVTAFQQRGGSEREEVTD